MSKGVSRHLFWKSFQHMADRERANELRESNRTIISFDNHRLSEKESFPHAMDVAGNYRMHRRPDDEKLYWIEEKEKDGWVQFHQQMSRSRSYYLRKGKKKRDGTYGEKRCNTKGVIDTYVTVPKWWTQAIAEKIRSEEIDAGQVKTNLKQLSASLLLKHEKRTGYEGIYAAVHPDSCVNLQIHLGVGTVDPKTHTLLGRSAGGTRGKRGLKELGDTFLYIWNLAHLGELPKKALKLPKLCFEQAGARWDKTGIKEDSHAFDDVALSSFLEKKLKEYFPACEGRAIELGKQTAVEFSSTVEKKMETKEQMRATIERLKGTLQKQQKELEQLRKLRGKGKKGDGGMSVKIA